ncbi:MAG: P-II family nitrogen regulator [Nocardioidaceae bacterium]
MKLVTAVLKPHRWAEVRPALEAAGVSGMTVSEVSGCGRQKGSADVHPGVGGGITLVPKLRVEIVVDDEEAGGLVAAILASARTEQIGDGKVWLSTLDRVIQIRTERAE